MGQLVKQDPEIPISFTFTVIRVVLGNFLLEDAKQHRLTIFK